MSQRLQSSTHPEVLPSSVEPESLDELLGDCRKMARHWHASPSASRRPTPLSRIHGVDVPERSAHLLDGMSDYGD